MPGNWLQSKLLQGQAETQSFSLSTLRRYRNTDRNNVEYAINLITGGVSISPSQRAAISKTLGYTSGATQSSGSRVGGDDGAIVGGQQQGWQKDEGGAPGYAGPGGKIGGAPGGGKGSSTRIRPPQPGEPDFRGGTTPDPKPKIGIPPPGWQPPPGY